MVLHFEHIFCKRNAPGRSSKGLSWIKEPHISFFMLCSILPMVAQYKLESVLVKNISTLAFISVYSESANKNLLNILIGHFRRA